MQLRFIEDRKTLFWVFVLFPLVPALGYLDATLAPFLVPASLYLAYCAGVVTHNHIHSPIFEGRIQNEFYAAWLSFFYGCPVFTWLPTHNGNHHRFVNGEQDVTRTTRYSSQDSLWAALTYPMRSSAWQFPAIVAFARNARAKSPRLYRQVLTQSAVVLIGHPALLGASWLYAGSDGLLVYALLVGAPALFAPGFMMLTNYLQHVGCDATSQHDHSRNFVNPLWNWFVFDAGYHTVHHDAPAEHWSRYRELHAARSAAIAASCNERDMFTYCARVYALEPLRSLFGATATRTHT